MQEQAHQAPQQALASAGCLQRQLAASFSGGRAACADKANRAEPSSQSPRPPPGVDSATSADGGQQEAAAAAAEAAAASTKSASPDEAASSSPEGNGLADMSPEELISALTTALDNLAIREDEVRQLLVPSNSAISA